MSKAFAEKVLDTIFESDKFKVGGGECEISWKQFDVIAECLNAGKNCIPNGISIPYSGNIGKYEVHMRDLGRFGKLVESIRLRDSDEVERELEFEARISEIREGFANGQYVGEPKKRMDFTLTLVSDRTFDGYYGTTHAYQLADEDGNCIVWMTTSQFGMWVDAATYGFDGNGDIWAYAEVGDKVTIRATIKEHSEYRGIKQTVITRAQVKGINR